ncbi:peroxide stress protein YaaA [Muriicola sp.]|uniref:peroxide stress protein YaaA n=1 Tax=Muriicola sp. TaxID=2020856 RepID=UPI003567E384
MKIIISPAKSLDFDTELPTQEYSIPAFLEETQKIHKVLVKKKPKALMDLMDISTQLAELNWERNQKFSLPFTPENARQAMYAFNGDVYAGLDAYTLPEDKLEEVQEKLRILSGLYGILRPLDLIQPYRLEMGTTLKIGRRKNLYDFWKTTLTSALNEEIEDGEILVNLASNEYYSALDAKKLKAEIITPVFKDWKNDKLRVLSFFAKKARGSMVRYLIESGANTLEEIKGFAEDGYQYSREHTLKDNQPVFVR